MMQNPNFRGFPCFYKFWCIFSPPKGFEIKPKQFAAYLQKDLGLKKGDRIALMIPNLLQYPVVIFGALRAGLIVVNFNPLYTSRELKHQLKDSGARVIMIFEKQPMFGMLFFQSWKLNM
ncbi:MAG: hypothetical protein Ct9H300mP4_13780 [Gammaproteobacteria bacterium]|nr:MAG: hypothetical protein Ct9H300mP4_13780 [Gammaproteobacteria bacterium]